MAKNNYGIFFKIAQRLTRVVLPRYRFEAAPESDKPVVYVSHHQNMVGPVSILAWLKYYVRTWVLAEFTDQEACFDHYYNYTFTERYGWPKWFAKAVAWPVSYIVPWLTKSGDMIPVYRGSRKIVKTMQISHEALLTGENIIIFPDVDYSDESKETSDIYEGFLHLEKKYYRETEEHLTFIPVFSDKEERVVRVGEKIRFTGEQPFMEERQQIAQKIQKELNELAEVKEQQVARK
jgi:1-acyl-sn-glycerol-3-phosphate acyltransferase